MAKNSKKTNPIITKNSISIGFRDAENDDEFLENCFVHHQSIEELKDINSPRMILVGRTGAGKTAIVKRIHNNNLDYAEILDIKALSMRYISNSDVLDFLNRIGANLDLLFQEVWKHVILIEYIKKKYKINNEIKKNSFFDSIKQYFGRDLKRKKSIEYLEQFDGKFFSDADENLTELIKKYESRFFGEISADIAKFKSRGNYVKQLSEEQKSDIVRRIRHIIDPTQVTNLQKVFEILAEYSKEKKEKTYILIDNLDEQWVDDSIRFKLIGALLTSVKQLRKIPSLKTIVAIRFDILDRTLIENPHIQKERFEDNVSYLNWDVAQLQEFVDRRMAYLYKRQYSKDNVGFSDVFSSPVGKLNPFEFMVDRTLKRPRDLLTYVNLCLERSQGKADVSANDIRQAEREYSASRLREIIDEWKDTYPTLEPLITQLKSYGLTIEFDKISTHDFIEDLVLNISYTKNAEYDPIYKLANEIISEKDSIPINKILNFANEVIKILFYTGAIGIKLSPNETYTWSGQSKLNVNEFNLTNNSKIQFHKMLLSSLNLLGNEH